MTRIVRINRDRLWACLMELKQIGAYDDEATGLQGVRRLALTDADAEARHRCVQWMLGAGLEVRVDRIGNVYATRPGRDRSLPCVLMGSHIDTVATGGAFDGTLGVLGGIEVMRTLNDAGVETLRDIEVGFFTEEEGVRFGTDMLGSAVTAGRIPLDHAHKLTDADGQTVKDELIRIGFDGEAHERRAIPHAYIECHIEQGPHPRRGRGRHRHRRGGPVHLVAAAHHQGRGRPRRHHPHRVTARRRPGRRVRRGRGPPDVRQRRLRTASRHRRELRPRRGPDQRHPARSHLDHRPAQPRR